MPKQDVALQHGADVATNALIWHLIVPCAVSIVVLGILAIAFEIVKRMISAQIRKLRDKASKRTR